MPQAIPAVLGAGHEFETSLPGDFPFSQRDFEWLRNLATQTSGIVLPETKRNMIYSRLAKRLRQLGLNSFAQYREILEAGDRREFTEFINALTTNLTYFFRETHHFDHLRNTLLPSLLSSGRPGRTLRVWSAGCSTGEEPYSLSMVLSDALSGNIQGWDYTILATDLDTRVLATAAAGIYPLDSTDSIPRSLRNRCFLRGREDCEGKVKVRPELQSRITFKQLNLVREWAFPERFDIVFCRNVVIYFDGPTQEKLFERIAGAMVPGGYLYIGHSESLHQATSLFRPAGKTIYRSTGPANALSKP